MNYTARLMQFLDSPLSSVFLDMKPDELHETSQCARNNRILFSFLEASDKGKVSQRLTEMYKRELRRYHATIDVVSRFSGMLTRKHVGHAIFKTVRPYKSTTVDIDVIIFGSAKEYLDAIRVTREAGYKFLGQGPMSTTFQDPEIGIGIDLYREIAVSYIAYLDKDMLFDYVRDATLPNGEQIRTLTPEADLAAIIAHSVIKEQMYTLSEYYTFVHYLEQMNVNNFIQIVKHGNITHATRTHASITALLHRITRKSIPNELSQILSCFGEDDLEIAALTRKGYKTPHKYRTLTVARSLIEMSKGEKSRRSIAAQMLNALNPSFTSKFLKALTEHVIRATY
jgi:hypothetical protein